MLLDVQMDDQTVNISVICSHIKVVFGVRVNVYVVIVVQMALRYVVSTIVDTMIVPFLPTAEDKLAFKNWESPLT